MLIQAKQGESILDLAHRILLRNHLTDEIATPISRAILRATLECIRRNPDSRHISLSLETQTSSSEQVVAKKRKLDDGESTKASLKKNKSTSTTKSADSHCLLPSLPLSLLKKPLSPYFRHSAKSPRTLTMSLELDCFHMQIPVLIKRKSKVLFTSQWQVSRRSQPTPVYEPSQELDARRQFPLPDVQGPQTHQRRFIDLYEYKGAHIKKKIQRC